MSSFETKDLLENCFPTTPQAFATSVKYPCTGFCYMVLENKEKVLNLYQGGDKKGYHDLIYNLIVKAGDRKRDNEEIDYKGEYLNSKTILEDFEISKKMKFMDFNTVDEEGSEYAVNTLFLLIFDLPDKGFLMVTRSEETFLLIKLSAESILVIDSHKSEHGTVDISNAIRYITRDKVYKGLIQIGYCE